MTTRELVGSVAALWRFPVKSMMGEQIDSAQLTDKGIPGDRAYALIDTATGRPASAKKFPELFTCRAAFVEPPQAGKHIPPVQISLPDGTSITSNSRDVNRVLSSHLGRDFVLSQAPADPYFDAYPVSVLTNSTLNRLNEARRESRFDARRFRMNLILDTGQPGFIENDWLGLEIHIGDQICLKVVKRDSRCVMTTLPQDDLPHDPDILKTLVQYNRILDGDGLYPCAGVYAVVVTTGMIRTGDRVTH